MKRVLLITTLVLAVAALAVLLLGSALEAVAGRTPW